MARLISFTQAAADALPAAKAGQSKDMLAYLIKTWGADTKIDQNKIAEDLMRKQFTPYAEGGVLSSPSTSSLVKIYELHKAAWTKAGFMSAENTEPPKPAKPPGKLAQKMTAYEARIAELEDALKGALAALSEAQKNSQAGSNTQKNSQAGSNTGAGL